MRTLLGQPQSGGLYAEIIVNSFVGSLALNMQSRARQTKTIKVDRVICSIQDRGSGKFRLGCLPEV